MHFIILSYAIKFVRCNINIPIGQEFDVLYKLRTVQPQSPYLIQLKDEITVNLGCYTIVTKYCKVSCFIKY